MTEEGREKLREKNRK